MESISSLQNRQALNLRFQGGIMRAFVRNCYEQGEGTRYAVEQTGAFTIPRFLQQLNRTRSITGKKNKVAGYEILARDLAADFTDTFLPGLLARYAIGSVIDKFCKSFGQETLVRHNMGHQALQFYEHVAKKDAKTSQAFYQAIEQSLLKATGNKTLVPLELEKFLRQPDTLISAQGLAQKLKLSDLDLKLTHNSKKLEITLNTLLRDLQHIGKATKLVPKSADWGEQLVKVIQKTSRLSKLQMLGNFVALGSSLAIPFAIRFFTRRHYGKDAFPGSEELEKHFKGKAYPANGIYPAKRKKFVPFPYLQKTVKHGNYLPLALTLGFFAGLAGIVTKRFNGQGASLRKLSDWFKVYEFDRGFPWTTIKQMELTYGLLCGMRLAASRNDAEFRETGIRDCLLGYLTLTYFFKWFRESASTIFNKNLARDFGVKNLLLKPNGEVRAGHEISESMIKNLGIPGNLLSKAVKTTRSYSDQITVLSMAISWFLLAYAEPVLGIWLTNKLEVKRLRKEMAELKKLPTANF